MSPKKLEGWLNVSETVHFPSTTRLLPLRFDLLCRHNRDDPKVISVLGVRGGAFVGEFAGNTCRSESASRSSGK